MERETWPGSLYSILYPTAKDAKLYFKTDDFAMRFLEVSLDVFYAKRLLFTTGRLCTINVYFVVAF